MTSNRTTRIPKEEFNRIYGRVPRLTVELIIRTPKGILLSKRNTEPCIGQWHIPGGTVFFGENLADAAREVAKDELGIEVDVGEVLGIIEYPQLHGSGYKGWPVGVAFDVAITGGRINLSDQAETIGYFKKIPENTVADQKAFFRSMGVPLEVV